MTSSTSIPAYLWHNSLRRWIENPASPLTKFLVPFLFGLLAFLVFGLMRGIEAELRAQLSRSDLRAIHVSESVRPSEATDRYYQALESPAPWSAWCQSNDLFLQAPITGKSRFFENMPIIGYLEPPSFVLLPPTRSGAPRPAIILTNRSLPQKILDQDDHITINESYRLPARLAVIPSQLANVFQTEAVALIPAEMLEAPLTRFHTRLQVLVPRTETSTSMLEAKIRKFAEAENLDVRVYSSQGILAQLEKFNHQQELIRLILGLGIAVILSLVLGSLSLLEFRQELYLCALLRSFGVRPASLWIHYLMETALITYLGGLTAYWFARGPLETIIGSYHSGDRLQIPFSMNLVGPSDLSIIGSALTAGILLSALPLVRGLRKPAGLALP
ncbi:MAG: FtsX-like permease family protein [Verrucomicrobia bacterium]|nr:MAG: FtsX-like permease family protein [Verrucomicrobiota bacterium]TAE86494.1 MAG: FtsX-like permease family protein [Verrucomicrobiota bacterium]TAF24130.1 MAG: FtsX-like permease family protein [Verrucomicrobiota bacterium]